MHRGPGLACRVAVSACVLVSVASAQSGRRAVRSPELDQAVVALKAEYAAFAKNPAGPQLRTECGYFKLGANVPLDALLVALERPVAGGSADGRQTAYIKWQLLSALPQTPDDDAVRRLLKVYERAPLPAMRYGGGKKEQRALDALIDPDRPQDDVRLNAGLDETVAKAFELDRPIVAYRDELYRRLPASREKFVAALRDAHARLGVAAQKDTLAENLQADLPKWALVTGVDEAGRSAVREVAELLGKLRFVESPPYYAYASVRSGRLAWRTRADALLTKAKFAALHKQMLDAGGVPAVDPVGATGGGNGRQASKSK
jgi:hypothetical protein